MPTLKHELEIYFPFYCDKFTVIRCIATKAIFQTFFHKIVVYRKTDSF